MQNEPDSIATPNPETVHTSSQPVCFLDDRTIVPVSMRMTLRAPELFQKL
jgi:hypothetical protein